MNIKNKPFKRVYYIQITQGQLSFYEQTEPQAERSHMHITDITDVLTVLWSMKSVATSKGLCCQWNYIQINK